MNCVENMNDFCVEIGLWKVGLGRSRSRESHCRSESSGFWSYAYGTRQYAYEMAGTRMALGNTRMDEEDDVLNVVWSLLVRVWGSGTRSIRV